MKKKKLLLLLLAQMKKGKKYNYTRANVRTVVSVFKLKACWLLGAIYIFNLHYNSRATHLIHFQIK